MFVVIQISHGEEGSFPKLRANNYLLFFSRIVDDWGKLCRRNVLFISFAHSPIIEVFLKYTLISQSLALLWPVNCMHNFWTPLQNKTLSMQKKQTFLHTDMQLLKRRKLKKTLNVKTDSISDVCVCSFSYSRSMLRVCFQCVHQGKNIWVYCKQETTEQLRFDNNSLAIKMTGPFSRFIMSFFR